LSLPENDNSESSGLRDALRRARLAEAARAEAMSGVNDAQVLRLQVLKDDLAPVASELKGIAGLVDLVLIPGETPRLWIDPVVQVVMAPTPQTYRLIQDVSSGQDILLETADRRQMAERIKQHIAHRFLARERLIAGNPPAPLKSVGYSTKALVFAAIFGILIGAVMGLVWSFSGGKFPVIN
jgi:hypothetical protein